VKSSDDDAATIAPPPGAPDSAAQRDARRTPARSPGTVLDEEERQIDLSLRPRSLAEFVGQERIKKVLGMSIAAARQRG